MSQDGVIPTDYPTWRECITVHCGSPPAPVYVAGSLAVPSHAEAEATLCFRRTYGDEHWRSANWLSPRNKLFMIKLTETFPLGGALPWIEVLAHPPFYADGLLPAIAQRHDAGEVLMLAWMNRAALTSGRVCYWSRSWGCLWRRGETSGHIQRIKELRFDCDVDALLPMIESTGPTCHTGRSSGFHNAVGGHRLVVIAHPMREARHDA